MLRTTPREVEYRTLRRLETLAAGNPAGGADPLACCFRTWPGPAPLAARRLAALANAARGQEALWIVGLEPRSGRVAGADLREFERWLAGLQPWFDGLAPRVEAWEVPVSSADAAGSEKPARSVVALRIETGRAPFVVRRGAGLEVPWTSLDGRVAHAQAPRSATRMELVKLLSPLTELPRFEVLEAELSFYKNPHATPAARAAAGGATFRWTLDACVYVLPGGGAGAQERLVLPKHHWRGAVELPGNPRADEPANGSNGNGDGSAEPLHTEAADFSVTADKGSPAVRVTEGAVLVEGLGRFFVYLCGSTRHPAPALGETATLLLDFRPAGADRTATVVATLHPELATETNQAGRWKL